LILGVSFCVGFDLNFNNISFTLNGDELLNFTVVEELDSETAPTVCGYGLYDGHIFEL
jgi:hypothetical protein